MKTASQLRLGLGLMASILSCVFIMSSSSRHTPAFASFPVATRQISSSFSGARFVQVHHRAPASSRGNMKSELNMFMGSDGGVLGIGTPELATILLVGYFVLGPSDLYKLTKEVGKAIQNFRTFSAEATSSLETNLESNLQLEEIRKAQRELNEAFSFRRSINVDADTDPFEVNAKSERSDSMAPATAAAAAATASSTTAAAGVKGDGDATVTDQAAATPRKKIRRRVKKRPVVVEEEEEPFCVGADTTLPKDATSSSSSSSSTGNVPADLDMTDDFAQAEQRTAKALEEANEELRKEAEMEEMVNANRDKTMNSYDEAATASLRKERMERLQQAGGKPSSEEDLLVQQELASVQGYDTEAMTAEQNRFQAQLGGTWNDQILNKNGELSPLADIMDRLAILEEEKNAADARLQEEFKLREANEETFYKEKRKLLEEAAQQVQAAAYATTTPDGQNNSSNSNPKV